jgi:voltage-gated potassium channel Kch
VKTGRLLQQRSAASRTSATPEARRRRRGGLTRLRYRFDSTLSRGPWMVIFWLAVVTVVLVVAAAAVIAAFDLGINNGKPVGLLEAFWQALLRVLDTGTFASDAGWPLRVLSLIVTVSGIFVATSLIGLVATSLDQRIADLRKGRSVVVEEGHTLVLGWSPRLLTMLSELVEANRNQRRAAVVILAGEEKTVMEERIRARLHDTGTTRVVCRTGDPSNAADLAMVNAAGARSIVVLSSGGVGDAAAVKAVLALVGGDDAPGPPVVAELADARTARALRAAVADRVIPVQADDVIAKVTAQACHQAGLSAVFSDLLDFAGDEIYFADAPELAGHTFGESLLAYETSSVIGRATAEGGVELLPAMDTVFAEGDQVIAVSEDDDTVVFGDFREVDAPAGETVEAPSRAPSRLLVVGWSSLGPRLLRELDARPGGPTTVDLVVDVQMVPGADRVVPVLARLDVGVHATSDEVEELGRLVNRGFDHVLVLGYRDRLSPDDADARTLLTVLNLRRSLPAQTSPCRVVAEVLDSRNVALARRTGADDFVVSDQLSSLMMAQLSERPELARVFDELFASTGPSIGLSAAGPYGADGTPQPFAAFVAAARSRGEVTIGYRRGDGEVAVNPPKQDPVELEADDQLVLLARDRGP